MHVMCAHVRMHTCVYESYMYTADLGIKSIFSYSIMYCTVCSVTRRPGHAHLHQAQFWNLLSTGKMDGYFFT